MNRAIFLSDKDRGGGPFRVGGLYYSIVKHFLEVGLFLIGKA